MDFIPQRHTLYASIVNTGRGLSGQLWRKAGSHAINPDGSAGSFYYDDDFEDFYPVTVTTAAGQLQPGKSLHAYIEADATVGSIKPVATEIGGVLKFLTSTDAVDGDNHDTTLTTGGNVAGMVMLSDAADDAKLTIFEARFKAPSVTNGDGSIFIGLGEEGLAAANTPIVDSTGHTLSSDDLIGFFIGEDDNDALKIVYRKAGQALQTLFTYGTALVADQWYKVGFVYDPDAVAAERIAFFIDNVEQATYITATQIAAATFPDGEELAPVASIKGSADNDPQHFFLDRWTLYQAG